MLEGRVKKEGQVQKKGSFLNRHTSLPTHGLGSWTVEGKPKIGCSKRNSWMDAAEGM